MKDWIYASVEFGSHTIKLLVSEFFEDKQNILFVDEHPSSGIEAGIIVDQAKVVQALQTLIKKAEAFLNAKLFSVVVMLPSINVKTKEVNYDLTIPENRVQGKHIKNLFNKVYREENNDPDREIAFIYPRRFLSSKTRKSMHNPINETTRDLFVSLEIVYEDKKTLIDYVSIVDACGLEVIDIMPSVVAYKNSFLTKEQLSDYACVVDVGDDTVTVTVYHDHLTLLSESFKMGASIATNKLIEELYLTKEAAEQFKIVHGCLVQKEVSEEVIFEQTFKDGSITYITSKYVSQLMDEAYISIIRVVRQFLLEKGLKNRINHYYLVGGAVEMEGVETLFKHNFGPDVTTLRPEFIGTRHPKYSTIISGHRNIYYLEQLFEENYQMIAYEEPEESREILEKATEK